MVDIKRQLKPKKFKARNLNKSAGILDDFAVRKHVASREADFSKVRIGDYNPQTSTLQSPIYVYNDNDDTTAGGIVIEQKGIGDVILRFLKTGSQTWLIGIDSSDSRKFKIGRTSGGLGSSAISDKMTFKTTGEVGVGNGATDPTQRFSVEEKISMTEYGGMAIKLTNKTGANTIKGQVVRADTITDEAVSLESAGGNDPIGVFYESGITDGQEAWVVISGIAEVAFEDNFATTRGYWVGMSAGENGYATASITPPAAPTHFEEIGHCIQSVAAGGAGTHILAKCVLHFN